jgi:hypothetical protein
MSGPKYPGVEESHKYGPVTERKETVKEICVPVYTEDPNNKYCHIPEKAVGQHIQATPVYYGVEAKSTYDGSGPLDVEEKQTGQLVMAGPVFRGVSDDSHYLPETTRVVFEQGLSSPGFPNIDHSSKNNPKMEKAPIEGQRLMTAPIFPGIEASNSYGTAVYS